MVRGKSERVPRGRGVDGKWHLVVQEMDPGQSQSVPSEFDAGETQVSAPGVVKGQPTHPATFQGKTVPARVHATWTRRTDGLVVEMIVNTANDERGPIAEWFRVQPVGGVTGRPETYRPPVRTLAKLAVLEWGAELPPGPHYHELEVRRERSKERKAKKYRIAIEAGDKAKRQGKPVPQAVSAALVKAGFPRPASDGAVHVLRSKAKKAKEALAEQESKP